MQDLKPKTTRRKLREILQNMEIGNDFFGSKAQTTKVKIHRIISNQEAFAEERIKRVKRQPAK
jgi:hypothetical protein